MKRPATIALAVTVATANLSGAEKHQQRRLRILQSENIDDGVNDTEVYRPYLGEVPDDLETQFQPDSSLSYSLEGGVDISSTLPILPHSDEHNMTSTTSHSIEEAAQVHISASSDAEGDTDILVPDDEAVATIRESQSETHQVNQPNMKRSGKSPKSASAKANKSDKDWNVDNHNGKVTHVPTMQWSSGWHSGNGKSGKSSQSPSKKHTSESNPPYHWNWSPNGKATKLFTKSFKSSKGSGWWPPHPHPSKMPSTKGPTTPSSPPSTYPPLVWEGVNGCTPESPCGACTGDCDTNEDCMPGLVCFKRSGSEQVPGCTSGGIGDIPGADYCYDPSVPPPVSPTVSPTPSPSEGSLPVLEWKGVNGCTPTSPCDVCQGDCDVNEDCMSGLECFKRSDGEYTQVPGCAVGGNGDIAGADYCYDPGSLNPPSASPTKEPTGSFPTNTPETAAPTPSSLEAFFLRSQAKPSTNTIVSLSRVRASDGSRNLQEDSSQNGWCAGGALAPDYYQLLLEECKPNPSSTLSSEIPIGKVEQMDQLWHMDPEGYIRSIFNSERCMMVSSTAVQFESPIEIGPCSLDGVLNQFYYETSTFPYTLKLQGEAYASMCVTFLGNEPSRGAEMVLGPCENEAKFGWDFVPETPGLGKPTMPPTTSQLPRLRYLGRDACTVESPCDACEGDCDTNEDCNKGLQCFQRDRGDSTQVPGCAVGGSGDIPGADYCYEVNGPTPSTSPTPELPSLEWRGSRGCSAMTPCPICVGDCNTDDDCMNALSCFKRDAGDDSPIPGCVAGGLGDIPGGDYCYNPNQKQLESSPGTQPGVTFPSNQGNYSPESTGSVVTSNLQSESTPTIYDKPAIPAKPDVALNDDTNSSTESTTASTSAQTPSGSKSSKASPTKRVSTNQ